MKWFSFEEIKNSSFYITPNLPIITTKRYRVTLLKFIGYLSLFTILSWIILIVLLSVTPLKDILFVINSHELKTQTERVQLLQDKVKILTQQLETVASTDEKMRLVLKLAQKDSIKSNDPLYDTLRKQVRKRIDLGGSVYSGFVLFIEKLFGSQSNSDKVFFMEPVHGIVTQGFNPVKGHTGIDYGVKSGSPVYSSAGGLIVFSDYTPDNGFMIIIQHGEEFISVYKHCSSLLKKNRDFVSQGELIALSGNSGENSTGPHLHFEIWHFGKPIDPQTILIK
jgi:murein DD-endopeptidase MepM/ murein hydrolase activator NlpD